MVKESYHRLSPLVCYDSALIENNLLDIWHESLNGGFPHHKGSTYIDEKTEQADIHPCTSRIQTYKNECCKISPKGRQLQNMLTLIFSAI
jgi:hypothetical protein